MTESDSTKRPEIHEVVDLETYPLHDPSHKRYKELVGHCREGLRSLGCASVPRFMRPEMVLNSASMVSARAQLTHRPPRQATVYGGPDDDDFPAGHPRRYRYHRGGGFICADHIDPADGLWSFYDWPETTGFMMQAFEISPLYQYADPLSNMAINAMWAGDSFPWHFDTNEFTVSIMLQKPEGGGLFEYVPNLRAPDNENYDGVKAVLEGDREKVASLDLNPGDLQLFKGRYSLHRVSEVVGDRPRFIALPSWSSRPGQVGVVERMINGYGRALPVHYRREHESPDALAH